MADINVERKKNIWPWIIGLVVLLLVIWGVSSMMGNDNDAAYAPTAVTAPVTTPAPASATEPAPADTGTAYGDVVGEAPNDETAGATKAGETTPPTQ